MRGISNNSFDRVLDAASVYFVFYRDTHATFWTHFWEEYQKRVDARGEGRKKESKTSDPIAGRKTVLDMTKGPAGDKTDAVRILGFAVRRGDGFATTTTPRITEFFFDRDDYRKMMRSIFSGSWPSTVKAVSDIPQNLLSGMYGNRVKVDEIFENIGTATTDRKEPYRAEEISLEGLSSPEIPHFANFVVNVPRYQTFLKRRSEGTRPSTTTTTSFRDRTSLNYYSSSSSACYSSSNDGDRGIEWNKGEPLEEGEIPNFSDSGGVRTPPRSACASTTGGIFLDRKDRIKGRTLTYGRDLRDFSPVSREAKVIDLHPYAASAMIFAVSASLERRLDDMAVTRRFSSSSSPSPSETVEKDVDGKGGGGGGGGEGEVKGGGREDYGCFLGRNWTARKIYFFIKDWLCDQVKILKSDTPPLVHETARLIQSLLTESKNASDRDPVLSKDAKVLIGLFENVWDVAFDDGISPSSDGNGGTVGKRRATLSPGILEPFEILSDGESERVFGRKFHKAHPEKRDEIRLPSVMHWSESLGRDTTEGATTSDGTQDSDSSTLSPPPQSPPPPPSVPDKRVKVLKFDRMRVSPLRLHASIVFLERRFWRSTKRATGNRGRWRVLFTETMTLLITDDRFLDNLRKLYVPHVLDVGYLIRRHARLPVSATHLHNYFFGTRLGLLSCMKWLNRQFCTTKEKDPPPGDSDPSSDPPRGNGRYLPNEISDGVIDYYFVLHEILDRFGSIERIRSELMRPFAEDTDQLWMGETSTQSSTGSLLKESTVRRTKRWRNGETASKTTIREAREEQDRRGDEVFAESIREGKETEIGKRIRGIKQGYRTIYSALRSFVHVYADHYISREFLRRLWILFELKKPNLKNKVPTVWSLVLELSRSADLTNLSGDADVGPDVKIPSDCARECGFDYPAHVSLYVFCCDSEISDEFATGLFQSISSGYRGSGYHDGTVNSGTPIVRFPKRGAIDRKVGKRKKDSEDVRSYVRRAVDSGRDGEKSGSDSRIPDKVECVAFLFRFLEQSGCFLTNSNLELKDIPASARDLTERLDELNVVDPSSLLRDPDNLPSLPIDVVSWDSKKKKTGNKRFVENDACVPVWNGSILEENWGGFLAFSRGDRRNDNSDDDNPFSGCHPDFLECILLYPVTHIQTLSDETMKDPVTQEDEDELDRTGGLDLDVVPPVDQRSFPSHVGSYRDDRLRNMMANLHKTMEDREGWNGNSPTLQHVLRKIKK